MQVEDAIVVHSKSGENASEPEYVPTEAEKISGDIAIDALPYIDTEVCSLKRTSMIHIIHHTVRYVYKRTKMRAVHVILPV